MKNYSVYDFVQVIFNLLGIWLYLKQLNIIK